MPGIWEEEGSIDTMGRAQQIEKYVLSTHYPDYLDPETEAAIPAKIPVKLATSDMKSENGRW